MAAVLAAVTGVLVWKYTDDAKNKAESKFDRVEAFVASKNIPGGTTLAAAIDGQLMTRAKVVREDLPPTRLDPNQTDEVLRTTFGTLVASHTIVAGLPVVRSDFVTAGSITSGVAGTLETDNNANAKKNAAKDLQAVTLTLDDEHAVGGFLNPGDRVNVIATLDIHDLTSPNDKPVKTTAFLLPGLKVLAVGSTTSAPTEAQTPAQGSTTPTTAAPQSRGLITFEVTPRQAEQLVQAKAIGTLTLSLNPPSWKPGDFRNPDEVVEAVNLFDQPLLKVRELLLAIRNAPKQ
jgi:pilus assembly protein CpaB